MRKMWDLLAVFVAMLFSLILWLTFFQVNSYTISSVINTGIVWIIGVVIIGVGAKFIGWLLDWFDIVMEHEATKLKKD